VDLSWLALGHYSIDAAGYLRLCLLSFVLLGAARVYATLRPDPRLAAMLFGTGFLCLFSLEASLLNYFLLTHTGPRIDVALAAFDRAIGFDWPAVMRFMAAHPLLNAAALFAYSSMLPQVALMTIVLGSMEPLRVYRFCAGLAIGALVCIAVWGFAPSFGAFSVYPAPPRMPLALDGAYAQDLVRLLRDGPGLISPQDARGLIGFPSYHAVLALLVAWHAWPNRFLRWPALLLNVAVLAATPVQGGHHFADVLGAVPVTAVTLFVVAFLARAEKDVKSLALVNKATRLGVKPLPSGPFCAAVEQKPIPGPAAIKPKLNAVP
jgi:hypothetical protein